MRILSTLTFALAVSIVVPVFGQSQFAPANAPASSNAVPTAGTTNGSVTPVRSGGVAPVAAPVRVQPPSHPLIRQEAPASPISKHDLILVVVQEQTRADVNTQLLANRETEAGLELNEFVRFRGLDLVADGGVQPNIDVSGSLETQALGRTNRNENLQLRITARVIDVLENGNVRIEGRRERRINDETTVVKLSGEIPRDAIGRDMSITSDRIADLKIDYSGDGPVSRRTGDTIWAKLADWVWPF